MKLIVCLAALALAVACQPIAAPLNAPNDPPREGGMHVAIPSRGANAILSRVATNGDIDTWMAVDGVSLSFRQGVLVGSRGLGFDLMGADATGTLNAIAGQHQEVYPRQMRYLTGDNHAAYLLAGCHMKTVGTDIIDGQRLRLLQETCTAHPYDFVNDFWVNEHDNIVNFRQWVSPEIGDILGRIK
ncbi:YjbF family lipoprotein [Yoonia sp. MH D7]